MDRYINLSDPESRALNAGASVLIVPIMPQPRPSLDGEGNQIGSGYLVWDSPRDGVIPVSSACMYRMKAAAPFVPGDILHAREAWAENCDEYGAEVIQYRAGGYLIHGATGARRDGSWRDEVFTGEAGEIAKPERWCSASQMPAWAVRHKYPVKSVSAIWLPEIEEEDAIKAGIQVDECHHVIRTDDYVNWGGAVPEFLSRWKRRHPKLPWESWAWRVEIGR